MTWIAVKKIFEKVSAWCVQHWRWLVFGLVALIAYITGRKNARNLWMQAELARKQYKKESLAIEKAYATKDKKIKKAEGNLKKEIAKADKKRSEAIDQLAEKRQKDIKDLVENPEKIDESLKNIGIDEV